MSSVTFKALIDTVHYDSKKGAVKVTLIGASHVSLDQLTTLSSKDETIQVTLESEQTKIGDVGDPIHVNPEEAVETLKEAAERLGSDEEYTGDAK
jgi:hypothetical protein